MKSLNQYLYMSGGLFNNMNISKAIARRKHVCEILDEFVEKRCVNYYLQIHVDSENTKDVYDVDVATEDYLDTYAMKYIKLRLYRTHTSKRTNNPDTFSSQYDIFIEDERNINYFYIRIIKNKEYGVYALEKILDLFPKDVETYIKILKI